MNLAISVDSAKLEQYLGDNCERIYIRTALFVIKPL